MGNRNGYFGLKINEKGIFLKLFPAQDNGEPIRIDEIDEYLSKHKINKYDLSRINSAIMNLNKPAEIFLSNEKIKPAKEEMSLIVSSDNMKVTARFYPSSDKPVYMNKEEILGTLTYMGIKHGIREEAVNEFIKEREYCKDYILAEGTSVVEGKNAKVHYFFNLHPNVKPKLNKDGSVDFHNLDNINRVLEGDTLATLEKEVDGTPGINIYGAEIAPKKVKGAHMKYGKGVSLSKDELSLLSESDGHVLLTSDGKVVVSNTYEISGDVDASTGDIKYDGNVIVKGHVCTGYTIIASGDVEVNGVVEGAKIIARGQIILKRGIQGAGKGILQAQGAIVAKFIESAAVLTNSSITTESILHSNVSAKGEIHVTGKKGMIVGGHVRSAVLIETQVAGSAMGGSTTLEVGIDPIVQDRMKGLEKELRQLEIDREKAAQMIDMFKKKKAKGQLSVDKIGEFQKVLTEYSEMGKRLDQINPELDQIYNSMDGIKDARVKVLRDAHPGVKLIIDSEVYYIMTRESYCQFYLGDDQLVKRASC